MVSLFTFSEMEKFAVDIDQLLDEFENNTVSQTSAEPSLLSYNIDLSKADFSPAPPRSRNEISLSLKSTVDKLNLVEKVIIGSCDSCQESSNSSSFIDDSSIELDSPNTFTGESENMFSKKSLKKLSVSGTLEKTGAHGIEKCGVAVSLGSSPSSMSSSSFVSLQSTGAPLTAVEISSPSCVGPEAPIFQEGLSCSQDNNLSFDNNQEQAGLNSSVSPLSDPSFADERLEQILSPLVDSNEVGKDFSESCKSNLSELSMSQEVNTSNSVRDKLEMNGAANNDGFEMDVSLSSTSYMSLDANQDLPSRTSSFGSVDRFLMPPPQIVPAITTPAVDAGFQRVPGYDQKKMCPSEQDMSISSIESEGPADGAYECSSQLSVQTLKSMKSTVQRPNFLRLSMPASFSESALSDLAKNKSSERDENDEDDDTFGEGARPKLSDSRKERPNSLVGLVCPSLPTALVGNNTCINKENSIRRYESDSEDCVDGSLDCFDSTPVTAQVDTVNNKPEVNEQSEQDLASEYLAMPRLEVGVDIIGTLTGDKNHVTDITCNDDATENLPEANEVILKTDQHGEGDGNSESCKESTSDENASHTTDIAKPSGIVRRPTSLNLTSIQVVASAQPSDEDGSSPSITSATSLDERIQTPYYHGEGGASGSTSQTINASNIGQVAPVWIPDAEAPSCMQCLARFTFTKRRHHCRACGCVFCSVCCSLRCRLQYLQSAEARVCSTCYQDIIRLESSSKQPREGGLSHSQPVSVLRKEGRPPCSQPKQVMFSDGIRPGGDLTELDGPSSLRYRRKSDKGGKHKRVADAQRNKSLIPDKNSYPPIVSNEDGTQYLKNENPSTDDVILCIVEGPVSFKVNRNLFVHVSQVDLECCIRRVCWSYRSEGMCTVGQDELVVLLECSSEQEAPPVDILSLFQSLYCEAHFGQPVHAMEHTVTPSGFLLSQEHCGMLWVRPTLQCLQKLDLKNESYLFGVLLQRWEMPWAKVLPLRLLLRLGAQYKYYPCPLISSRFRTPVFGEIGHTIINLLADFRNYQYILTKIDGSNIEMQAKRTVIKIPGNRYQQIMKVVGSSNEHVMSWAADFSRNADSHLVCMQNEDGSYHTQAINIQSKERLVTGACFVVFNGSLKLDAGYLAKSSIVEDGLMLQVTPDTLKSLKHALKEMQNFVISCGPAGQSECAEEVHIQWVEDDCQVNIGVKSLVDNSAMDGIPSVNIHSATDFPSGENCIRWTKLYFMNNSEKSEPGELSQIAESLAQALCVALVSHLHDLWDLSLQTLGLRATLSSQQVGYEVGANGNPLPEKYMRSLDEQLIPVIHNAAVSQNPIILELTFHILQ